MCQSRASRNQLAGYRMFITCCCFAAFLHTFLWLIRFYGHNSRCRLEHLDVVVVGWSNFGPQFAGCKGYHLLLSACLRGRGSCSILMYRDLLLNGATVEQTVPNSWTRTQLQNIGCPADWTKLNTIYIYKIPATHVDVPLNPTTIDRLKRARPRQAEMVVSDWLIACDKLRHLANKNSHSFVWFGETLCRSKCQNTHISRVAIDKQKILRTYAADCKLLAQTVAIWSLQGSSSIIFTNIHKIRPIVVGIPYKLLNFMQLIIHEDWQSSHRMTSMWTIESARLHAI